MSDAPPAWRLWRELKGYFPAWSLIPSSLYTPGAWGMLGVDFLSGLRRNRSTRQSAALLASASDADLEGVASYAALNLRRQELMLRAVLVAYISVPVTLLATGAQIAPARVEALIREHPATSIQLFAACSLGALYYVCTWWRARQIVSVLDLIRIDRGLPADPAPDDGADED